MRSYLKRVFITFLAMVTSLLLFVVMVGIICGVFIGFAFPESYKPVERGSVLEINMDEVITDSPALSPLSSLKSLILGEPPTISILSTLRALEYAAEDPNVTALSLRLDGGSALSLAQVDEIREALILFKEVSSKPIYAYSEGYSQSNYLLASVADSVMLHPLGAIEWQGVATSSPYYGDLLKGIGVDVEVFRPRECSYKSAVEPYTSSSMSSESREQSQTLVDNFWESIISQVAQSRNLRPVDLREAARTEIIIEAERALQLRMVDAVGYRDQYDSSLERVGVVSRKGGGLRSVTLGGYSVMVDTNVASQYTGGEGSSKIAIIYADGVIVDGGVASSSEGDVVSGVVARELRRARLDESVKAVVVRVNSPGGSALAADVIWREMELLRGAKPVIVSMSSYAASGGYYISAPADVILANRYTVTGSIGVYGLMMAYDDAMRQHLLISHDGVVSSPSADLGRTARRVSALERAAIMRGVDEVYDTFREKVARGRELPMAVVNNISEGRIWGGEDALDRGLVDGIGGISKALSIAIERCGLSTDKVEIVEYGGEQYEEWLPAALLYAKSAIIGEKLMKIMEPMSLESGVVMRLPTKVEF